MPQRRNLEFLNAQVNAALQLEPDITQWAVPHKTVRLGGRKIQLRSLANEVRKVKVNGVSFFGHGRFVKYLVAEHGFFPFGTDLASAPDDIIRGIIGGLVKRYPPSEVSWTSPKRTALSRLPIGPYGFTLIGVQRLLKSRNFFGCGSWKNYLRTFHGIDAGRRGYPPGRPRGGPGSVRLTDSTTLNEWVKAALQLNPDPTAWRKGPVVEVNERKVKLPSLYNMAHRVKVGGKSFFGYGNWTNYLMNEHGVFTLPARFGSLSDTDLLPVVDYLLKKYPPERITWTQSNTQGIKIGNVSLSTIYNVLKNRGFSGKGSWRDFIAWRRSVQAEQQE